MTNFQAIAGRRRLLTPERLALLWPLAGGAVVLVLTALVSYPPLLEEFQLRRKAIAELKSQEEMLPLLRRQLAATVERQENLTNQQTRLLTLVAGTAELKTLLASINDLAAASGLSITQVEPGKVERHTPPPSAPAAGAAPDPTQVQSSDPLLAPNLEKRSAQITLSGSYPALRSFLQRLEALQVVTIASELVLRPAPPTQQAPPDQQPGPPPIELTLTLSAYGRVPPGQPAQTQTGGTKPPG